MTGFVEHHRRSIRLPGFDYAQEGAYFVTLCTQGRECLLGEIVDGQMRLNDWGEIAADSWAWLARQYDYIVLDNWVIMPNHLHGIIIIDGRGGICTGGICTGGSRTAPTSRHKPLGRLIGAYKTVSTKRINELRGTPGAPLWQRNYYEHIIRNEEELNQIRQYIVDNPVNWETDQDHVLGVG